MRTSKLAYEPKAFCAGEKQIATDPCTWTYKFSFSPYVVRAEGLFEGRAFAECVLRFSMKLSIV